MRTDVPWKPFLFAAALAPLAIPGVLYTIAWIFLASPRIGILNVGPIHLDVFSPAGMIVVEGFHSAPLVFLLMVAAFRALDPSLEESAVTSGARPLTAFRRVTLPLVLPALWAAVLIVAVRALESFEAPALIGIPAGFWVFTSRIWRALGQYPAQLGEAGAYSLSLLVLTAVGVVLLQRLGRRQSAFAPSPDKGFAPGRSRCAAGAGPRSVSSASTSPSRSRCRCSCSCTRRRSRTTRCRRATASTG